MPHGAIEWVEIPANDLEQSTAFYETVFGWKINRGPGWEQYPMFTDAADKLGGGFLRGVKPMGEAGIMLYITVDDIEAITPKITANGGRLVTAKTQISPEIGWWASFHDPAGNLIGLYERVARA